MKIIINNTQNIYIKEKSKFIGIICKVYTKEEVNEYLSYYKKKYSDATHLCYAYSLPTTKKYSDDNEPTGTAGIPILDILEKNNLYYVLAIVIRYYGGIKLGANGLVRAYSHSISETLINNTKDIEYGYLIRITENYLKNDEINYLIKDAKILKKEYQDKIIIDVLVNCDTLNKLVNINYQILKEKVILFFSLILLLTNK